MIVRTEVGSSEASASRPELHSPTRCASSVIMSGVWALFSDSSTAFITAFICFACNLRPLRFNRCFMRDSASLSSSTSMNALGFGWWRFRFDKHRNGSPTSGLTSSGRVEITTCTLVEKSDRGSHSKFLPELESSS